MSASRFHLGGWPSCAVPTDGQLTLVTALSDQALAVSVDDALFHLRIDAGTEDSYVEKLIRSVQQELVPPTGWLGRALTTVTYRQTLPSFADTIRLAGGIIQELTSIEYLDNAGATKTVDPTVYRLTNDGIPSIVLKPGQSWPTDVLCVEDAVAINYDAGFGDTETDVPEVIKEYILLKVGTRYDNRKDTIVGTIATPTPYVEHMLDNWRIRL